MVALLGETDAPRGPRRTSNSHEPWTAVSGSEHEVQRAGDAGGGAGNGGGLLAGASGGPSNPRPGRRRSPTTSSSAPEPQRRLAPHGRASRPRRSGRPSPRSGTPSRVHRRTRHRQPAQPRRPRSRGRTSGERRGYSAASVSSPVVIVKSPCARACWRCWRGCSERARTTTGSSARGSASGSRRSPCRRRCSFPPCGSARVPAGGASHTRPACDALYVSLFALDLAGNVFDWYDSYTHFDLIRTPTAAARSPSCSPGCSMPVPGRRPW